MQGLEHFHWEVPAIFVFLAVVICFWLRVEGKPWD